MSTPESTVRRTVLPGGLRVVTEFLPAVRSVALGIWVGVGSRDEGASHAAAALPLAIDVLSDMVTSSLIEPKDVDAERNVVLEEIAINDDDPSDSVHEAFTGQLFGDTPLGRPILGTVDSINSITREQIFEHYQARYTPPHLVVSAAGNLEHEAVVELVRAAFVPALGDFG